MSCLHPSGKGRDSAMRRIGLLELPGRTMRNVAGLTCAALCLALLMSVSTGSPLPEEAGLWKAPSSRVFHYVQSGDGHDWLLLHGRGAATRGDRFGTPHDYRITAVDLMGFGDSASQTGRATLWCARRNSWPSLLLTRHPRLCSWGALRRRRGTPDDASSFWRQKG